MYPSSRIIFKYYTYSNLLIADKNVDPYFFLVKERIADLLKFKEIGSTN